MRKWGTRGSGSLQGGTKPEPEFGAGRSCAGVRDHPFCHIHWVWRIALSWMRRSVRLLPGKACKFIQDTPRKTLRKSWKHECALPWLRKEERKLQCFWGHSSSERGNTSKKINKYTKDFLGQWKCSVCYSHDTCHYTLVWPHRVGSTESEA